MKRKKNADERQERLDFGDDDRSIPDCTLVYLILKIYEKKYGMTADDIAETLGCGVRHARRYIENLSRIPGFTESEEKRDGKTVYSFNTEHCDMSPITEGLFSLYDVMGLMTIKDLYNQHPGTSIPVPLQRAFDLLEKRMTPAMRENIDNARKTFLTKINPMSDYTTKAHIIDGLLRAIQNHKVVEIDYSSVNSKQQTTRHIHPYLMMSYDGSLYVVAFDPKAKTARIKYFKIDRIHSVNITRIPFQPDFDYENIKQISSRFGIYTGPRAKVVAEFDDTIAPLIREKKYHETQVLEELPENRLRATWHMDVTVQVKSMLMSYGSHVQILEPETLREEIRNELMNMGRLYDLEFVNRNPANVSEIREQRGGRETSSGMWGE